LISATRRDNARTKRPGPYPRTRYIVRKTHEDSISSGATTANTRRHRPPQRRDRISTEPIHHVKQPNNPAHHPVKDGTEPNIQDQSPGRSLSSREDLPYQGPNPPQGPARPHP
jgi:hypothetical protein